MVWLIATGIGGLAIVGGCMRTVAALMVEIADKQDGGAFCSNSDSKSQRERRSVSST